MIDITNPLTADYMGLTIGHSTSAAEEIAKAVASDDVRQQYIKVALDPVTMGPKEYRELLEREIAKYQGIGREAKIEKL